VLYERHGVTAPYDGEVWSWAPPEMNRIAYVDKGGDLWMARVDGRDPQRVMKGNFTLPAWSEDGRMIAVAERKNGGKKWEISVVTLPPDPH
jgi:Tol biopolymer transport system component